MTITLFSKELCKDIKPQTIHASLYLCHTMSKVTIKHKEEENGKIKNEQVLWQLFQIKWSFHL